MAHPVPDPLPPALLGAPELDQVRVGFMALTDCAPVVMASILGFDRKHGVRIVPCREASWAAVRDKLLRSELHMADMLYGMVYGVHLGIGSPRSDMAVLMTLNRNGQGITLSRRMAREGITTTAQLGAAVRAGARRYTLAQTFPTGTHAMWLSYWLASLGVDPLRDVRQITVAPPLMVASMRAGVMDGCCVGEPWNAVAVADEVGFTVATSQEVWPDHPEKVLGATRDFVRTHPNTTRAAMAAILEACRWIDASEGNRTATAGTLAGAACVDTTVGTILPRILGDYADGLGGRRSDAHAMAFHADGQVNFPWLSDGMWFLTQFRRWGLLRDDPDYEAVARAVNDVELYREVAGALGVPTPSVLLRSSTLIDGRVWDGSDPQGYAAGFDISARGD
jgi:nitrate/nitrite transport system substrate-binding protein